MSSIVVPSPSELLLLRYLLGNLAPSVGLLNVFNNDITLSSSTVIGDFTFPVDPAYVPIVLNPATWAIATIGGVAVAEYPQQTFSFNFTQTLYGYIVSNVAGTALLWAQKADCVTNLPVGGGTYLVTPRFKLKQSTI